MAAENNESPGTTAIADALARMKQVFGSQIHAIALPSGIGSTRVNEKVTETAPACASTPQPASPHRRRIGHDPAQHAELLAPAGIGEEVHGLMESADGLTVCGSYSVNRSVLDVLYPSSARLLRIDATESKWLELERAPALRRCSRKFPHPDRAPFRLRPLEDI